MEEQNSEQQKDIRQIVSNLVNTLKHGSRCEFIRFLAAGHGESFDKWFRLIRAWSKGNFSGKALTEEERHRLGLILAEYKATHMST